MIKPLSLTGEELIFYNYKEPLKEIKGGYGYYGVLLATKDGDGVQCHVCGKTFKRLDMHARESHDLNARDYKEKFGLAYRTALISEKTREELKLRTINWLNNMTPEESARFKANAIKRFRAWRRGKNRTQPDLTLETKNKRGTCPDQLLEKIKVVAEAVGHSPTKTEFIDHWKSQKYLHIIYKTFGSWDKAKEMAGYEKLKSGASNKKKDRYSNDELLEYLQIFYQENGKPPTETDCRRGLIPESSIYRKRFGSFPLAREAAGITEEVGRWIKK